MAAKSAYVTTIHGGGMVSYPVDREAGGDRLEKEREAKDDGRYIIFYTFGDDETGKARPDGEENG